MLILNGEGELTALVQTEEGEKETVIPIQFIEVTVNATWDNNIYGVESQYAQGGYEYDIDIEDIDIEQVQENADEAGIKGTVTKILNIDDMEWEIEDGYDDEPDFEPDYANFEEAYKNESIINEISDELRQRVIDKRTDNYNKAQDELNRASDKLDKVQDLAKDTINITLSNFHLNTYKVDKAVYEECLRTMQEPDNAEDVLPKLDNTSTDLTINLRDVDDGYETLVWDGLFFWNLEYPFNKLKEHNLKLWYYSDSEEKNLATFVLLNKKLEYPTDEELNEFDNGGTLLLGSIWCEVTFNGYQSERDNKLFMNFLKKTGCTFDIRENYTKKLKSILNKVMR